MKRRFVQSREAPYDFIEVTDDYSPDPRNADSTLWNDRSYDGLRATDGTDISSRSKHREYMKANGLTTLDDFKGTWAKARQERDRFFTQGPGNVRPDVERAIAQLQQRKR